MVSWHAETIQKQYTSRILPFGKSWCASWGSEERLCNIYLQEMDCSHAIRGAMDLKLHMGHFNGPGSDYGARGSSWPPLGCHCSIRIHHRMISLLKCKYANMALELSPKSHLVRLSPFSIAYDKNIARPQCLEIGMVVSSIL